MTLVQLRHFLSVAETGSFTRSAAQVYVTQSALSRSLRALEIELGEPLLVRHGLGCDLTDFGRQMVGRARALLDASEDLQLTAKRMAAGTAGTLRVGMSSMCSALLATRLCLAVMQRAPDLHLEIVRGDAHVLEAALRARKIDAMMTLPLVLGASSHLRSVATVELESVFLVRPGHPLLDISTPLPFSALMPYPMATTEINESSARMLIEAYGPDAHPDRRVDCKCQELPALIELAMATDTILIFTLPVAPSLVRLPVDPPAAFKTPYSLLTLAERAAAPALGIVTEVVEAFVRTGAR